MSLYSTGGTSFPDLFLVLVLSILSLVSTLLNPLVMVYNLRKKNSIPKILFFLLALCDFITNLVVPANTITGLVKRGDPVCSQDAERGFVCQVDWSPRVLERAAGVLILTLDVAPSCFTAVLAITRFMTIRFPFRTIKIRYALIFVALYLVYCTGIHALMTFDEFAIYRYSISLVTNPYFLTRSHAAPPHDIRVLALCIWPLLVCQVLSGAASACTVLHLVKTTHTTEETPSMINSKKVSMKILVTNVSGIVVTAAAAISSKIQIDNACDRLPEKADEVLDFVTMVLVPVFLACLNPIIFILFTPNVLKVFKGAGRVEPGFLPFETTSYPRYKKTDIMKINVRDTISSPI